MGNFFGSIYCLFEDFFGLDLAEYLWGSSSEQQTSNMFVTIGIVCTIVSAIIFITYYYILNHPRLARRWVWLIVLGINAIMNFGIVMTWLMNHKHAGKMVGITNEQEESLPITISNVVAFGISNAIISMGIFMIFVILLKCWSKNCWHIPFRWDIKRLFN